MGGAVITSPAAEAEMNSGTRTEAANPIPDGKGSREINGLEGSMGQVCLTKGKGMLEESLGLPTPEVTNNSLAVHSSQPTLLTKCGACRLHHKRQLPPDLQSVWYNWYSLHGLDQLRNQEL